MGLGWDRIGMGAVLGHPSPPPHPQHYPPLSLSQQNSSSVTRDFLLDFSSTREHPVPILELGTSSWLCLGSQGRTGAGWAGQGRAGVAVASHLSMLRAQRLSTVMPTEAFWMKGTSLQTCTPKGQSLARSWGGATGHQAALGMGSHQVWGAH